MKAHIGVDADSRLVHSVAGTSANVPDVSQAHALLHGHEEEASGDAGCIGVDKRDEMKGKSVISISLTIGTSYGQTRRQKQRLAAPTLKLRLATNTLTTRPEYYENPTSKTDITLECRPCLGTCTKKRISSMQTLNGRRTLAASPLHGA